jgi:hypothetical protein
MKFDDIALDRWADDGGPVGRDEDDGANPLQWLSNPISVEVGVDIVPLPPMAAIEE